MQYAWVAMTVSDLLPRSRGDKPDSDRDQAGDCQRMEHAKRVLSMQRQRRHIHENQRKDVDGSDPSVGACPFGPQQNSGTCQEC